MTGQDRSPAGDCVSQPSPLSPRQDQGARPNGRDVAVIFAAVAGVYLIVLTSLLGAAILFAPEWAESEIEHPGAALNGVEVAAVILAYCLCIYLLGIRRRGLTWSSIGFRRPTRTWVLVAVALGLMLAVGAGSIDAALGHPAKEMIWRSLAPKTFSWTWIVVFTVYGGVLAPILEETLFRGILYTWLRRRWGAPAATFGSASVFALVHVIPLWMAWAGFFGLVLALVYERSGTIVPAILLHATYNTLAIALFALSM